MSDTFVSLFCMTAFAFVGIVVLGALTTNYRPRLRLPKGPAGPPRGFWWDDEFAEEGMITDRRHAPQPISVDAVNPHPRARSRTPQ